ncbi:MAG: ABC transporter ATP-binding protein [Acidimicrobiales bacterium]
MASALCFEGVTVRFGGADALVDVDWEVRTGQRWAVLGPNGSGKTTLTRLATGYLHPTAGRVTVLGHRLGRVDVRELRRDVGLASAAVSRLLRPGVTALEAVLSARHAALETWWHTYSSADEVRARALLDAAGLARAADRRFGDLSEGERQQVILARTLMQEPGLLLLDEPAAGLDLAARERLLIRLSSLADDDATPPLVFVTHHLEEVPAGFTHALLLREGAVVASGAIDDVLQTANVSACFDIAVSVDRVDGRWTARARQST